jgi:FAD/FMN-containing dehydrogenase
MRQPDWRRLMEAGRVLRPGEPGFGACMPFNKRFAASTPDAVVSVTGTAGVLRAIEWAREAGVRVMPRGGGHSYAGYSAGPGLVVDLRALNAVSVDPSTGLVTAGGGALMADVYAAIQPHGVAFPLGNGGSVGIGGLVLGGGSAATSRAFGLTADALVQTTVAIADGRLLTCDANRNADLYWACRGGGGGNFGINVSFTFQARPVPDVSTCLLLWEATDARKVLAVLQDVARQAPDELSLRLGVSTAGGSRTVVSAIGQHLGPASELRELLDPALAVARPVREDIADRTFWQAKDYLAHETSAGAFAVRTNFATQPLPDEAIAAVLSHIERWPGSANPDGGGLAIFGWGGAINRIAPTDTAFPHRSHHYLVAIDTSWAEHDDPTVVAANLGWLSSLHETLAPFVSGGAYVNFPDPDLPDWPTAYYGPNYPRLVQIKRHIDPDNLFTFDQAIGR